MQNTKRGIVFGIFLVSLILVVSVVVVAKPGFFIPASNKGGATVIVPAHAIEIAPGLFSLGTARDVDGRVVEGFMFIDKKKENAKPGAECGNDICESGENARKCPADCSNGGEDPAPKKTCFSIYAKGARWKKTEPYVTSAEVDLTVTEKSLNTWDSKIKSFNIFGTGSSGTTDGRDEILPDGKNEVDFDDLGTEGTVAVTITWIILRGPPGERELIEWDTSFNNNYDFGDADNNSLPLMDYQNIATHEFGHSLGLGHPDDSCTEETMYRFVAFNEIKKRDLNKGDIAGVKKLY